MAVPKRRISTTRKKKRRTHKKLEAPKIIICKQCGEPNQPHTICKECGTYDGKKYL